MPRGNLVRIAQADPDLTIGDVLSMFRRRRRVVLLTAAAVFLLVALYCLVATPHYKATAIIEVQRSSNDLLSVDTLLSSTSGEMGDALNAGLDIQTQVEILKSDTLALKVIQQLSLEKNHDFQHHWSPIGALFGIFSRKGFSDSPQAELEDAPARRSYVTSIFQNHLKVKPVVGSRLIEVAYTNSDPKVASAVVNHLTQALMEYGFTTRNLATKETSEWLQGQLADLKRQAQDLQARVVALQRDTGIYSLGEDAQGRDQVYSATLDRLQLATAALSAATSSRIMKGALYDTIRNGDPEMISGLAGSGIGAASSSVQNSLTLLQNLRTQQSVAAAQLAQDTSKFGSAYPKLADERSLVASLDHAVADEVSRIGERAKNDYEAARATEARLQGVYGDRKLEAGKLNDRAIEYGIAKQEADNSRALYEDLSKRLNEAGVVEGLRSSNISVVSPARVPAKPSVPNPPLYLAAALILGLFLGMCGAVYTDITDDRIYSLESVEASLDTAFLGVLPSFPRRDFRESLTGRGFNVFNRSSPHPSHPVAVLEQPNTAFAEALRRLGLSVLSSRGNIAPKVILVTSSVPSEGKTAVAINLAALLAQSGKKTLYVTADMRRPRFIQAFSSTEGGLSDLLTRPESRMHTDEVEGAPRLQVLSPGPATNLPAELLSTDRMRSLVNHWKLEFDCIVLDSPSLLDVTDALILSRMADITLLLARYRFTTTKSLERSYRMLEATSDTRIGVVINAVDRKSVTYNDYFGYSGSTYYQAH